MAYPTTSDLSALLVRNGQTAPGTSIMQSALDDAVAEWESLTAYDPFLASGSATARYFDPPQGCIFRLRSGVVSVTSVYVGIDTTDTTGTLLVVNEDYFLYPLDAASKGKPYTYMKLRTRIGHQPRSVKVTADWGYCASASIPADVTNALLRRAAEKLFPEYATAATRGLQKVKQDTVEKDFGNFGGMFAMTGDKYGKWFESAAARYRYVDLV